jgi:hypothetical protein
LQQNNLKTRSHPTEDIKKIFASRAEVFDPVSREWALPGKVISYNDEERIFIDGGWFYKPNNADALDCPEHEKWKKCPTAAKTKIEFRFQPQQNNTPEDDEGSDSSNSDSDAPPPSRLQAIKQKCSVL